MASWVTPFALKVPLSLKKVANEDSDPQWVIWKIDFAALN